MTLKRSMNDIRSLRHFAARAVSETFQHLRIRTGGIPVVYLRFHDGNSVAPGPRAARDLNLIRT